MKVEHRELPTLHLVQGIYQDIVAIMQILSGPQKNRGGQMIIIGTYIVAYWTEDEI